MPLLADITEWTTNALNAVSDRIGAKNMDKVADKARGFLANHATQFVAGTIVLMIGIVVTGWVARAMARALEKRNLEPPERLLIIMVARIIMIGLTIMVALDVCGYPIAAVFGGAGVLLVGLGFAMQGLFGNIIAGLTLIFTKPIRVGEYVEIASAQGLVIHVDIISTTLMQLDHSKVVIPNHKIIGEVLRNFGTVRQIVLSVGVAYDSDLPKARELAAQVLARNRRVLTDPTPLVTVTALRDSAIAISIKCWVKVADYELAEGELNEAIVECYRHHQIEIPFPRRDIRIITPIATEITSHEQIQKSK